MLKSPKATCCSVRQPLCCVGPPCNIAMLVRGRGPEGKSTGLVVSALNISNRWFLIGKASPPSWNHGVSEAEAQSHPWTLAISQPGLRMAIHSE